MTPGLRSRFHLKSLLAARRSFLRQYFSSLLLSFGALLVLYVTGTYVWMYGQQRAG